MPTVYLSPSTQEYNPYVTSAGTEEYFMNLIADAMIPYLQQFGINYYRNTPEMTAGSSLRDSNSKNVDFHLPIHSNASGPGQEGRNRGVIVFYYPRSANGQRMARTTAPAVLIEVAYHDNVEDAEWIQNNIDTIARALADSLNKYFSTAELQPGTGRTGRVNLTSGYLNIRNGPATTAPIIGMAPNGASVNIIEQVGDWYRINYDGIDGYVSGQYINVQ